MYIQSFRHHLLKRLLFLHQIVFTPLLKILWPYMGEFISHFSLLFQMLWIACWLPEFLLCLGCFPQSLPIPGTCQFPTDQQYTPHIRNVLSYDWLQDKYTRYWGVDWGILDFIPTVNVAWSGPSKTRQTNIVRKVPLALRSPHENTRFLSLQYKRT